MTELSPTARALVDAARDGLAPDAAAIRRMRANIATAAAGGATVAGAGSAAKLGLFAKLAIVAAVTGAIVGVVVMTRKSTDDAVVAPSRAVATRAIERPAIAPPAVVASPEVAAVDPNAIEIEPPGATGDSKSGGTESKPGTTNSKSGASGESKPGASGESKPGASDSKPGAIGDSTVGAIGDVKPGATDAKVAAKPDAKADAKSAMPAADLAREVALVDRAMAALRDGDPNSALAATHRYDVETRGKGQLAEDAAAIAVEALCLKDDPTANSKLQAFDARWPHSAQRARVRATCQR